MIRNNFFKRYFQLILISFFLIFTYTLYFVFYLSKNRPTIQKTDNYIQEITALQTSPISDIRLQKTYPIEIRARNFIAIQPEVSGRVIKVNPNLKVGKKIKKNEILFHIDPRPFTIALTRSEGEYQKSLVNRTFVEADSKIAIENWKSLFPEKEVPDLVAKKPDIMLAKSEIQIAKSALEQAKLNLSYTHFKLPVAGIIHNSTIEVGSYVQAGQSYGNIYRADAIEAILYLTQQELSILQKNSYSIEIQGKEKPILVTIDRISPTLDPITRRVEVILMPAEKTDLKAGEFLEVKLNSQDF